MGDKEIKIIAAAFVAFVLFAAGVMVLVLLKDQPAAYSTVAADLPPKPDPVTETLFGKTWTLVGCPDNVIQGVPIQLVGGRIEHWTNGNSGKRLLRMYAPNDRTEIQECHWEQSYIDGKWAQDGKSLCVAKQGRDETDYVNDKENGMHRAWYKNGQLWQETPYINGKREGIGRGWNDDGSPQWEATYENNIEIFGKWWSTDGEVRISKNMIPQLTETQIDAFDFEKYQSTPEPVIANSEWSESSLFGWSNFIMEFTDEQNIAKQFAIAFANRRCRLTEVIVGDVWSQAEKALASEQREAITNKYGLEIVVGYYREDNVTRLQLAFTKSRER